MRVYSLLLFASALACADDADDVAVSVALDAGLDAATVVPIASDAHAPRASEDAAVDAADSPTDERVAVAIRFRAQFGTQPWECGKPVSNQGTSGTRVTPLDLRAFVSKVRLLAADGSAAPVELVDRPPWQALGAALLDFAPDCRRGPPELGTSNLAIVGRVAPGNYSGIAFENAVPAALSGRGPDELPPPFEAVDLHWEWLRAIRFLTMELATSAGAPVRLLVTNTACSNNAGAIACARPNRNEVRLLNFAAKLDTIVFDVSALLATTALHDGIDCHAENDQCASLYARLGIEWSSGQPLASQHVYRVER